MFSPDAIALAYPSAVARALAVRTLIIKRLSAAFSRGRICVVRILSRRKRAGVPPLPLHSVLLVVVPVRNIDGLALFTGAGGCLRVSPCPRHGVASVDPARLS